MRRLSWLLALALTLAAPFGSAAEQADKVVDDLEAPLYNPFVERYILDELKQLRRDLADTQVDLTRDVTEREMALANQAVRYATDTVTYFFYLIAGVSTLLVFVGWSSIRDMKDRIQNLADKEIAKLVSHYENRLEAIEVQLRKKSADIEKNQEEIDLTRELHSLWLRAAQEPIPANRLAIYDQILTLDPRNTEAMTYKADVVLEMGEPRWAAELCGTALAIDPDNAHACYQMACACAQLDRNEQAIDYLRRSIELAEHYREEMLKDAALQPLQVLPAFQALFPSA